jgi:hypothetical protein
MHTPSHMLIGGALYGRRRARLVWAALLGGLLPDVPMFVLFAAARMAGADAHLIFEQAYFSESWQAANGLAHSLLLWPALLAAAVILRGRARGTRAGRFDWLAVFAASGLTHAVIDFLCHREDAHMQFWPLSRWKFVSPISYYERAHFGGAFMVSEMALALASAAWLIVTVKHWPTRVAVALLTLPYLLLAGWLLSR